MSLILDGTNGLSDVDGSAATPAIRGSDANTGVFFGTDVVGLSTGGSERMRITSAGNVGIGTSSPDNKLEVALADNQGINLEQTGAGQTGFINWRDSDGTLSGRLSYDHGSDAMRFNTAATERMRIDSSGNLFVGKTANTAGVVGWTIQPNGTGNATFTLTSANEIFVWDNTATTGTAIIDFRTANTSKGRISWNNTNTTYATTSDYRLKHDIQPMTGALAKVAQLKPVTYKWNADDSESQGFIAHELQAVVPECVTGEKDAVDAEGKPQYQGIDTSFLVATLTAAIQEQQAIITALTARVEALEGAQA
jgi:hypothetical protein